MSINKLQLKRSAVVGKIPNTASLDLGELAINTIDGKIYFKQQDTGSVQRILELTSTSGSHLSASYAQTASYSDRFIVGGTLTAQTLIVQTVSSSIIYSSGSNTFGNSLANNQIFTGSVNITGSLTVNGRNYLTDSASFDTRIRYVSSSFEAHTASFNAFSSSILRTTASINAFSASALSFTASTLINSASFDTRIKYVSSSFEAATASFNAFSSSVLNFTASTLINSSSFDTRIKYLSSSFEANTASFNAFSSSMNANSASMNAFSASMLSFTASQKNSNGTFATTGSNTFVGTQTITGSNGRLIYTGTTPGILPTLAEIHANNDYPWLERFYNDTFSTSSAVMAYYGHNDGRFVFHNESSQSIGLQVNGFNAENGLLVHPDKVAFVNNIEVSGSVNVYGGGFNVDGVNVLDTALAYAIALG
jgi:hypothetical protein